MQDLDTSISKKWMYKEWLRGKNSSFTRAARIRFPADVPGHQTYRIESTVLVRSDHVADRMAVGPAAHLKLTLSTLYISGREK